MVQKIIITDLAQFRFEKINQYVLETWGIKVLQRHLKTINNRLELIQSNPEVGKMEFPRKKIRSMQTVDRIKIYYQVFPDHIRVVSFFNTYQSPRKRLK